MEQTIENILADFTSNRNLPGLQEFAEKEGKDIEELENQLQIHDAILADVSSKINIVRPILLELYKMTKDAYLATVTLRTKLGKHKENYAKLKEAIEDLKKDQLKPAYSRQRSNI